MTRITSTVRSMASGVALAVLVAACSASAVGPSDHGPVASSSAAASATATPASPTARPTTTATQSVVAATQSPQPSAPTACDLLKPEEVAKVMHLTAPVESNLDEAYCSFDSGGLGILHYSYRPDRPDIVASWQSNGLQSVPGIGDSALWNAADGTFIVVKDDGVVAISFDDDAMTPAERLKFGKAVAAIMATRM
jgi:hypothetical protein